MKLGRILIFLIIAITFVGCGNQKVDTVVLASSH